MFFIIIKASFICLLEFITFCEINDLYSLSNSQELVAEVSGLEKQRDQLEAELKKVFDYLSSLNCLICKAKDENFMVNGVF